MNRAYIDAGVPHVVALAQAVHLPEVGRYIDRAREQVAFAAQQVEAQYEYRHAGEHEDPELEGVGLFVGHWCCVRGKVRDCCVGGGQQGIWRISWQQYACG